MEIFREGDKSKAICSHCKKIVPTTFKVRDSVIKDGTKSLKVPSVLVGVCDNCDRTVSIPQQSFAAVSEVKKKSKKRPLEVRLPRHFLDILNNSLQVFEIEATSDLRGLLVRHYLASVSESKSQVKGLKPNLESNLREGSFKRNSRLPLKVSSQLDKIISKLEKDSGLNKTELVESVILQMKHDILDKKNGEKIQELQRALLATG